MKPINEVYPDYAKEEAKDKSFYGPSDYQPLLESFGYEILLQVDDGAYQGDSRLILRDGERYGLLTFGWGSCSGCDGLQACNTMAEIEELRQGIYNDIHWEPSSAELLKWVSERDWETQSSWYADETKEFVAQAKTFLASEADSVGRASTQGAALLTKDSVPAPLAVGPVAEEEAHD